MFPSMSPRDAVQSDGRSDTCDVIQEKATKTAVTQFRTLLEALINFSGKLLFFKTLSLLDCFVFLRFSPIVF